MGVRRLAGIALGLGAAAMGLVPFDALANGVIETRSYSVDAWLRLVIAAIGGVIAVLGIVITFKTALAKTDVTVTRGKETTSLQMTGVTQGVMITILGVVVLVAGLYFLPQLSTEEITRAKEITITPGGERRLAN